MSLIASAETQAKSVKQSDINETTAFAPFTEAFSISFRYASHVNYAYSTVNLGIGLDGAPAFIGHSLFEEIDYQPADMSWVVEYESDTSAYFALRNLQTGEYLARATGSKRTQMLQAHEVMGTSGYIDEALWTIELVSAQDDMAIFNKSEDNKYAIVVNADDLTDTGSVEVILADPVSNYTSDYFLQVNDRYENLLLNESDIVANDSLLRLPNGLATSTLFIPSPDSQHQNTNIRRFKVSIREDAATAKDNYAFANHVGERTMKKKCAYFYNGKGLRKGKKNCDWYIRHGAPVVKDLKAQINNLPVVTQYNLDVNNVYQAVFQQLQNAFSHPHNAYNDKAALIWLPMDNSSSIPQIFTEQGMADLSFDYQIQSNSVSGQSLLIEALAKQAATHFYYFVFLLKKTAADGTVSYVLSDPGGSQNQGPIIKV